VGVAGAVSDGMVSPAGMVVVPPGVVAAVSDGLAVEEELPANAQPVSAAALNNNTSMTVMICFI